MPQAQTILPNDTSFAGLDFQELRSMGLAHIARFSGDLWTDHNLHDPGITILEVLCYALADLGYRTRLPVADLLAKNLDARQPEDNFFSPAEILTNNPLTVEDYRKLLLDIPGVRNAWLEKAEKSEVDVYVNCERSRLQFEPDAPCKPPPNEPDKVCRPLELNGLYHVYIELEPALTLPAEGCDPAPDPFSATLAEVHQKLHDHRNLCEDFLHITVLQPEEIAVCGDVELEPDAVPETVLTKVYEAIQNFLSPAIRFYSLEEMVKKGKSIEEIFEGRPLTLRQNRSCDCKTGTSASTPVTHDSHGFIDPEELRQLVRHTEIHASDIYRVIMGVEGVRAIKKLFLVNFLDGAPQTLGEAWCLRLSPLRHPVLSAQLSNLNFFKGVLPFRVEKRQAVEALGKQLRNFRKVKLPASQLDRMLPQGNFRPDLSQHRSVIHEFPLTYAIGQDELPRDAPPLRRAQSQQLRAYLLFFDQLLANYLGQLGRLRDLFSMRPDSQRTETERRSVFEQPLTDVPDAEHLLRYFSSTAQNTGGKVVMPNPLLTPVGGNGCPPESQTLSLNQVLASGWRTRQNEDDSTEPTEIFDSPETRDIALERTRRAFENGQTTVRFEVEKTDGIERVRFYIHEVIIENQLGSPLLRSSATYPTQADAQRVVDELQLLGAMQQAYLSQNQAKKGSYTFSLTFNPLTYAASLRQLAESQSAYLARRDAMLSHLLARFAEHFTDYVLLMFALNKQRNNPAKINEDKANFLTHYPAISRNRGKASNYADPAQVWNSPNITGLERRVTALMGIHDWQRQTLSNFEVVRRTDRYRLVLKDQFGSAVFTSEMAFPTLKLAEDAWLNFTEGQADGTWLSFPAAAADPAKYRNFDCAGASAYGFELIDKNGCQIASHPITYPTPQLRDAAKACLQKWAAANGSMSEIKASGEGFYFKIYPELNPSTQQHDPFLVQDHLGNSLPLFESPQPSPTEDEAWQAFLDFYEAAQDDANYFLSPDPVSGRQSFYVGKELEDGTIAVLGKHPLTYPEDEANERMQLARQFLQKKYAAPAFEGGEELSGWELHDEQGNLLLHSYLERLDPATGQPVGSRHLFKTRSHAAAALVEAVASLAPAPLQGSGVAAGGGVQSPLQGSGVGVLLKTQNQAGTEFYLRLENPTGFAIGHSTFDSAAKRDAAEAALLAMATSFFKQNPLLEKPAEGYLFHLYHTAQPLEVLLKSTAIFRQAAVAVEAGEAAAAAVLAGINLQVKPDEGDCDFFVEMTDACGERLAKSPAMGSRGEAETWLEQIKLAAEKGKLAAASARPPRPREVSIESANRSGQKRFFGATLQDATSNILLRSHRLFATRHEALLTWLRIFDHAKDPANFEALTVGDCDFRAGLKDPCGGWLATSEETFGSPEALADWLAQLAADLQARTSPLGFSTAASPIRFLVKREAETLLVGERWYDSVFEAKRAFFRFLCTAGRPENYQPLPDPDGCRHGFQVVAGGTTLATHPVFYPQEIQSKNKQNDIANWAAAHCLDVQVKEFEGKWNLQIIWRSCDGCCRTLLEGPLENTLAIAQENLSKLLDLILKKDCTQTTADGKVQIVPCFVLRKLDEPGAPPSFFIADHLHPEVKLAWFPNGFASVCLRDSVMKDAERYLCATASVLQNGVLAPTLQSCIISALQCEEPVEELATCLKPEASSQQDPDAVRRKQKQEALQKVNKVYGFRLRREEDILARHPGQYKSCQERDEALKDLWKKLSKGAACFFTNVATKGRLVVACELVRPDRSFCEPTATELYYFQILDEQGKPLFRSWEGFNSEAEALAGFENQHVGILTQARLKPNYSILPAPPSSTTPQVILLDPKGEPVAEIAPASLVGKDPDMVIQRRIEFARAFPVVQQADGTYSFQLSDVLENEVLWQSVGTFPTAMAAWDAFCRFLDLMVYRGNWLPFGSSEQGSWSFELGNVLLESRRLYASEDDAWDALKDFLLAVQEDGGIRRYRQFAGGADARTRCNDCETDDPAAGVTAQNICGFGFEGGGEGFLLARHPNRRFRTYEERELTLDWLFRSARCREKLYSKTGVSTCQIKGVYHFCITDEGFGLRNLGLGGKKEFNPADFLPGTISTAPCLWRSYEGYATEAEARKAAYARRFEILELAKEPGFYSVVKSWSGSELLCQIQLVNLAGQPVAFAPKDTPLASSDLRLTEMLKRIYHARLYPFTKTRDGYRFQLYDPGFDPASLKEAARQLLDCGSSPACAEPGFWGGCVPPTPPPTPEGEMGPPADCGCDEQNWLLQNLPPALLGGVVWESASTYSNLNLAVCAFGDFLNLLPNADAYRRAEEDECGPYAIELTDPSKSLAWHPLTHPNRATLNQAVDAALAAINVEGFHVLEHILLRPVQATFDEYVVKAFVPAPPAAPATTGTGTPTTPTQTGGTSGTSGTTTTTTQTTGSEVVTMQSSVVSATATATSSTATAPALAAQGNPSQMTASEAMVVQTDGSFGMGTGQTGSNTSAAAVQTPPVTLEQVTLLERTFRSPLDACRYLTGLWQQLDNCLTSAQLEALYNNTEELVKHLRWLDSTWVEADIGDKANPKIVTNLERLLKYHKTLPAPTQPAPSHPCDSVQGKPAWLSLVTFEKKQENAAACDLLPICTDAEDCDILTRQQVEAQPASSSCGSAESHAEDAWYASYLPGADPYSFWATVMIPFWSSRFIDVNFRSFFEETIRREAPAWVGLRILWVHPRQMRRFEQTYRRWLQARTAQGDCDLRSSQRSLIEILKETKNEYLPARLFDCGAGSQGNVVFLDQTKLG